MLVTGATGFLGSWLVKALAERGAQVLAGQGTSRPERNVALAQQRPNVQTIPFRLEDKMLLERCLQGHGIDSVFHLAAGNTNLRAGVAPLPLFEANVRGVYLLLEAVRQTPTVRRVVIASSAEARGGRRAGEAGEQRVKRHAYQASKLAAELITQSYHDTFGLPVAVARCYNVYGGGDFNWNRLIPGTIRSVLTGASPVLRSDGTLRRDYIHVDDIVAAYLALGQRAGDEGVRGEIFHFGTGARHSTLEIVCEIIRLSGRAGLAPVVRNESKDEIVGEDESFEREAAVLGWRSTVGIDLGLASTLAWYEEHLDELKSA